MEGKLQMSLVNKCKWCKYLLTAAWKPWILGVRTGYLMSGDLLIPLNTAVWSAIWKTKKQTNKCSYSSFIPTGFAQMQFLDVNTKRSGFVLTEKPQDISQHALEDNNRTFYLCYPLWRHEASGFDDGQPGLREHVYQLDFDLCRHYFLQKHNDAKVLGFYEHIQGACTSVSLRYWDE